MVFNIQFQIAGIILLTVILIMYARQRALNLLGEGYFLRLFASVYISLCLDILSVIAINYRQSMPYIVTDIMCKMYLVSVVTVAVSVLLYTIYSVFGTLKNVKNTLKMVYILFLIIYIVLECILPIQYHKDINTVYTYGPAVMLTYMAVIVYVGIVVVYMLKYMKMMPDYKRYSIFFLIVVWVVTATVQFFNNERLLVGYSMSVSLVYMYMKIENPERNIDKDTGAFNRNTLYTYIANRINREDKGMAVLVFAIDDYSFINETFGYRNASIMLKKMVDFFCKNKNCTVFKRTENEFTIVYDNMEMLTDHLKVIKERFEKSWKINEVSLKVYFNACYLYVKRCDNSDVISDTLNYFLMKCKKDGNKNIIEIDDEKLKEKREITKAEYAVKKAIEERSIDVYYQPIYSNAKKRYISAEALVRIRDEEGRFVSPELFIPIAEQNGRILEIGKVVFEKVCQMIRDYNPAKYGIEYIEVNLSVVQCMQENLAKILIDIMNEYGISPSFINLEITETAAIKSEKIFIRNMDELIAAGSSFTIDDYGSGYSNMNYVIGLPISIVKIDKYFVWSYFKSEKAKIAFEFAVSMLHSMNLKIVAEGIEEKDQAEKMYELGVDDIQGYYYSKPVDTYKFIEIISRQA